MINFKNIQAMLRDLVGNNAFVLSNAGAPTSGTSGTGVGICGKGSLILDITNGAIYQNTGTITSPTWSLVPNAASASVISSAMMDPTLLKVATGTITSANITGTSAGQLGHANGVELVAAPGAGYVLELISAILINDFSVAAYTGGGNTTVNIGSGGAALTGLVSNANFIQATADKIIEFVPLAATFNTLTANVGINLVTASAPTNPGTAAGVFRYHVMYRRIATGL